MKFVLTATYLGIALTAAFIAVLIAAYIGEIHSTNTNSRLTYLLYGFFAGYAVFYIVLLLLPQLWSAGGG